VTGRPALVERSTAAPLRAMDTGLLSELFDHLDAMVAYWNQDRVCLLANAAYQDWFGKPKDDVIGSTMQQLLGPLYVLNAPYIDAAFAGRKQVFEREIPVPNGAGTRHSLATYTPHVVDGRVRGIFVHVADVTRLKQLERQLQLAKERAESLAAHDVLTGLPDRLLLDETANREIADAQRTKQMLGVLVIDFDDFKAVNDSFGHAAGDQYLVDVCARLRTALRHGDVLFRVGGDEFVALLPGLDSIAAFDALATRLVAVVREPLPIGGNVAAPAVSIGGALYPQHGQSVVELLGVADRSLYEAKARGGDRYSLPSMNARGLRS
jgi:diguanylate cyclase (GGDEF)-like protein/PAS domain S-box-containing protein